MLAGSHEFIAQALRHKHQFGGAMRQAGIIAAGGVYALTHNVERLAEDHDNAKRFPRLIAQVDGVAVDADSVETNMVYFDVAATGLTAPEVSRRLLAHGVRIGPFDSRLMRAVTHLDVDTAGVEQAAQALRTVVGQGAAQT